MSQTSPAVRLSRDYLRSETALVIGNGHTRRWVDLKIAHQTAWLFGCNVIIRDAPWIDYVCAVDGGPIDEWVERNISGPVYVHPRPALAALQPFIQHWQPFPQRIAFYSGMVATLLAVHLGCDPIWLIGFDQDGSNVYKGTEHYDGSGCADPEQTVKLDRLIDEFVEQSGQPRPRFYQMGRHTFPWAIYVEVPDQWYVNP